MRAIFISYRREDTEGQAGRLFDDLVKLFGEQSVFMDVAGIEPGRDFRKAIDEHVASCGVLLALIGKNWVDARDEAGRRRIDDPLDFVRLETAAALKRDIPVVPVLVRGASMPRADQLPPDLADLAFRNAIELTHARWTSDLTILGKALSRHLTPSQPDTADRGSTERGTQTVSEPPKSATPRRAVRRAIWLAVIAVVLSTGAVGWGVFTQRAEIARREAVAVETSSKQEEARQAAEKTRRDEEARGGPNTMPPTTTNKSLTVAGNGAATPIDIPAPSDPNYSPAQLSIMVSRLPLNGKLVLADGTTAVAAGEQLTVAQLTRLMFVPTRGVFNQSSTFTYSVKNLDGQTASGIATLVIGPNTMPPTTTNKSLAVAGNSAATPIDIPAPRDPNYSPAQLSITVFHPPLNGKVVLADGTTAVAAGEQLTVAQLTRLMFVPTRGVFDLRSTLKYSVKNLAGLTAEGNVTLFVRPSTTPPVVTTTDPVPHWSTDSYIIKDPLGLGSVILNQKK